MIANDKCWWTFIVLGLFSCLAATAADWTRVAYDDAGKRGQQPHLVSGSDFRYEIAAADEALRTVAFGETVEFGYAGLNPKAAYKAKIRLLSDGPRTERLKAGETELAKAVVLEPGKMVVQELELPAAAYADGKLKLSFEKLVGPNAVVSDIEVLSSDPAPLTVAPVVWGSVTLPQLTPRPEAIADLGGTWKFTEKALEGFEKAAEHADWKPIAVPGEWLMQGFNVDPKVPAAYFRTFKTEKPAGQRFKLRFSAVYGLCKVWVNGIEVGNHDGGFVPFEFDVTEALKAGTNTLALSILSDSLLSRLSCGSQYARHDLGGITRKVQLFSVPEIHVSDLKIATTFDADFRNATLDIAVTLRNQSAQPASGIIAVNLAPAGKSARLALAPTALAWKDLPAGTSRTETVKLSVPAPSKWDCEHPNLYRLTVRLQMADGTVETLQETFGFRQVEVRGTQIIVNGQPVKLHGACRHEVHPLLGRALTPELWKKDAELYRAGNCNLIRTSHYPPAEEFIAACDKLGLFVELEAPICWVGHGASDYYKHIPKEEAVFLAIAKANLEAVQGYPNHPAVIIRSLGNESAWSPIWARVHALVRQADPTRLTTFHDQCWGAYNNHGSAEMPVGNHHYPGPNGAPNAAKEQRPIYFGEYSHLNSYNRRELATDPGLRDLWGRGLEMVWEKMQASPVCQGGSIWAAMDDTFFLPNGDTVGYGTWGPLDAWRREKPEYWHMKKAYSPIHIAESCVPMPKPGEPIRVKVENRHDFTNLNEIIFHAVSQKRLKTLAKLECAPRATGILEIPADIVKTDGDIITILATSRVRGAIDRWQIAIGTDPRVAPALPRGKDGPVKLEETGQAFVIRTPAATATIDATTGTLTATVGGSTVLTLPELMILPANGDDCGGVQMSGQEKDVAIFSNPCQGWKATAVTAKETPAGVEVRIEGNYTEAAGSYTLAFGNDGTTTIRYAFMVTEKGKCGNPRQIGLVFSLPGSYQNLFWRRLTQWSDYPQDHIGRPIGRVNAFAKEVPLSGLAGPRIQPTWSWSQDGNKYGTNDFRSTKMNILEANLDGDNGHQLRILSDGKQHVRAWVDGKQTRLLVAEFANEGAPPFFDEHTQPHRNLKAGDKVEGTIRLEIR
jgi:hypothetical protein